MLYTMGMALDRAFDHGHRVSLLVEGCWIDGAIAAVDGQGVVLELGEDQHAVVRVERIAAVRVQADSPFRTPVDDHAAPSAYPSAPNTGAAHPFPQAYATHASEWPVPGPRSPSA